MDRRPKIARFLQLVIAEKYNVRESKEMHTTNQEQPKKSRTEDGTARQQELGKLLEVIL